MWGKGVLKKHPKDVSQEKINLQVFPNLPNFAAVEALLFTKTFRSAPMSLQSKWLLLGGL